MDPYLQRAHDEIAAATAHLTVAQVAREIPGKWSIALILEHLTLAYRLNAEVLETAIERGETRARKPTPAQWLSRLLVVEIGYFPRSRAPEAVTPTGSIPPGEVRAALAAALTAVDAALTRAAARFGEDTPLLKHAVFAALTVRQWRKFHWRHAHHHVRQVRERSSA